MYQFIRVKQGNRCVMVNSRHIVFICDTEHRHGENSMIRLSDGSDLYCEETAARLKEKLGVAILHD